MSARVTVTTEVVASPPPGLSTRSGQAFILGATQKGPVGTAVKVTSLAAFRQVFGDRAGGSDTFDTVEAAFKEGLAEAWVSRLAGPAAAAATNTVGTLTVTAISPGAWGNELLVGWDRAYSALIVDYTMYPGADLETIQAALATAGVPVTVSGTLPTADVDAVTLAGGTDDAAAADPATGLGTFGAALGDGAVVVAGKAAADVAEDLAAHCEATNRLGVMSVASGATLAAATAELVALPDEPSLMLAWPEPTAGVKKYPAAGYALGVRARAHATGNPVQSPISPDYGTARFMTGVVTEISDEQWKVANAAGLSVIRGTTGQVRMYGWRCIDAPDGAKNLQGANYRDLIDRVAAGCQEIAEGFVGKIVDGKGLQLAALGGRLTGFLDTLKGSFFAGENDPGYVVDAGPGLNPPAQIARGEIRAEVGIRCAGTAEFITIAIVATDAAGTL